MWSSSRSQAAAPMTMLRHAHAYSARGFHLFPVRGKTPLIEGGGGFLSATTDERQIRLWFRAHPDAGLGCWPGPSGYLVIDEDGPDGVAAGERLGAHDVETLICVTGRDDGGRHLYFKRPSFSVSNIALAPKIDVRCDGGYVILPPSPHPSGRRYQWTNRGTAIAEIPPRLLAAIRAAKERAEAPVPTLATRALAPNASDIDRRVRGYMARIGCRGEGEGRNNLAYSLSAWLVRDLALDSATAFGYVAEWNAGNAPPLGPKELKRTFNSAVKHARRQRGCALADDATRWRAARARVLSGEPPRGWGHR